MTPEPIPLRSQSTAAQRASVRAGDPAIECRNCGAGAPVDEQFCPQCSRILALGRHGDFFSFLGLPRKLVLDANDLERRFRELSRKFHPDYFYNAPPAERLASLERSSYLNDAYRALKNPVTRIEHLLAIEGLPSPKSEEGQAKVPPSLLEEVFALNEELDEIRELRESGANLETLRLRLEKARQPVEGKRKEHERQLDELSARWDSQEDAAAEEKRATLDALRERLLERNYINNLLAGIEREMTSLAGSREPGAGRRG
jgi:molecular chaperone HscB